MRPRAVRRVCLVPLLLLSLLACQAPVPSAFEDSPLVRPGARVELGAVTASPSVEAELAEAVPLLRDALSEALDDRDIAWAGEPDADRFLLDVHVADYAKGNAFLRWLAPGLGTTVLAVEGRLVDRRDGTEAGRLDHRRSVAWGGAYTIGAWKTIFSSVARDVAGELDHRIAGKGFVIRLEPWATLAVDVPKSARPLGFHWGGVEDSRPHRGRIGEREALGVSMSDVFSDRAVPEYLREAITDELLAEGHPLLGPEEGEEIGLDVHEFWVETRSTPLYWDVIGVVAFEVTLGSASIPVRGSGKTRTYVWPREAVMAKAIEAALIEAMSALRSSPDWPLQAPAPNAVGVVERSGE